jgi:hypothetical protein
MTRNLGCRKMTIADPITPRLDVNQVIAETIINISGLASGDRVLCGGDMGSAIETAAIATGARLLTAPASGETGRGRWLPHARADVALFAVNNPWRGVWAEARFIHSYLRPGGRLVMWTAVDRKLDASIARGCFQRFVGRPMFTSAIVGQLPTGCGVIVAATGIFVPQPFLSREALK